MEFNALEFFIYNFFGRWKSPTLNFKNNAGVGLDLYAGTGRSPKLNLPATSPVGVQLAGLTKGMRAATHASTKTSHLQLEPTVRT